MAHRVWQYRPPAQIPIWLSVMICLLLLLRACGQSTTIALGIYQPEAPGDPAALTTYVNQVGRSPAVVMWFQGWAQGDASRFPRADMDAVVKAGAMPMLTWEPWNWTGETNQPNYALNTITNGAHDTYIRQWARDAAAWGKPFYLRFGHEMNSDWYPWSAQANGNSATGYINAWRHIVTIFRQAGATNIRWVWCVNVSYSGSTPFAQTYPGDAWVDWVALDGYNWGTAETWASWESFADTFAASYDELAKLTNKPMMISEVASTEEGGDKAAWIKDGFLTALPKRFPRIRAVIWFNETKEAAWAINSSPTAQQVFRAVVAAKEYQGKLP